MWINRTVFARTKLFSLLLRYRVIRMFSVNEGFALSNNRFCQRWTSFKRDSLTIRDLTIQSQTMFVFGWCWRGTCKLSGCKFDAALWWCQYCNTFLAKNGEGGGGAKHSLKKGQCVFLYEVRQCPCLVGVGVAHANCQDAIPALWWCQYCKKFEYLKCLLQLLLLYL